MIVQITITRNELFLIKEMMPLWTKYSDGFIFMLDRCDDGTYEYLMENKEKYNILNILYTDFTDADNEESSTRQRLYDEAFKHSGNIICLDTDEYLDGSITKQELEEILNNNKDMLIHLQWIQYTDKNQIRTDGPWKFNLKDRVASYSKRAIFKQIQRHSEHLPVPDKQGVIYAPFLFIAHLQWLDKPTVAVKQYYWKILDYITRTVHNIETIPVEAYDASVNNFNWTYENFDIPLKIDPKIYNKQDIKSSYKYKTIQNSIKQYNIPNLNDWQMGIHQNY
jgi:hypothetical protein